MKIKNGNNNVDRGNENRKRTLSISKAWGSGHLNWLQSLSGLKTKQHEMLLLEAPEQLLQSVHWDHCGPPKCGPLLPSFFGFPKACEIGRVVYRVWGILQQSSCNIGRSAGRVQWPWSVKKKTYKIQNPKSIKIGWGWKKIHDGGKNYPGGKHFLPNFILSKRREKKWRRDLSWIVRSVKTKLPTLSWEIQG